MNTQGFFDAINSYAYKQWMSEGTHVTPWDYNQILNIIQSSHFKEWQNNNPNGTIDQYYIYLCNRQAYLNSPEYKIECLGEENKELNDEITELKGENKELNNKISELKEEISEKDDNIGCLETLSGITLTTSFIFLIISCVLLYKLRKRR